MSGNPRIAQLLALLTLLVCTSLNAEPVIHKFELWGVAKSPLEKLSMYWGWTNGFLPARGPVAIQLADCLYSLSSDQAVAMIDKQYHDHPETWSRPFTEQVLQALTIKGGPCEGKNPLDSRPGFTIF